MTPEQRFEACAAAATAREQARDWPACAEAWIEAGRAAVDGEQVPLAVRCLVSAAEAFRRADRPVDGRRALASAQALGADGVDFGVRLAGVMVELGDPGAVEVIVRAAGATGAATPPHLRAAVIDTRIGIAWQWGRKSDVVPLLDALRDVEPAPGIGWRFRDAELARMDGALDRADAGLVALIADLAALDPVRTEVAVAAANTERAELCALRGDAAGAREAFAEAAHQHAAGGRRSLALRAQAGAARAAVAAGVAVLTTDLVDGLGFARDRGLSGLRVELETALAMATAGRDPRAASALFASALSGAERRGGRLQRGRVRLERALAGVVPEAARAEELALAADDLADDVIRRDRALALLGTKVDPSP